LMRWRQQFQFGNARHGVMAPIGPHLHNTSPHSMRWMNREQN